MVAKNNGIEVRKVRFVVMIQEKASGTFPVSFGVLGKVVVIALWGADHRVINSTVIDRQPTDDIIIHCPEVFKRLRFFVSGLVSLVVVGVRCCEQLVGVPQCVCRKNQQNKQREQNRVVHGPAESPNDSFSVVVLRIRHRPDSSHVQVLFLQESQIGEMLGLRLCPSPKFLSSRRLPHNEAFASGLRGESNFQIRWMDYCQFVRS